MAATLGVCCDLNKSGRKNRNSNLIALNKVNSSIKEEA
jgi:hypothetical protein